MQIVEQSVERHKRELKEKVGKEVAEGTGPSETKLRTNQGEDEGVARSGKIPRTEKLLRFREPVEGDASRQQEEFRQEVNVKIQCVMEELQNTITTHEFEKRLTEFEKSVKELKWNQSTGTVQMSYDSRLAEETLRRVAHLESSLESLSSYVARLLKLVEKEAYQSQKTESKQECTAPILKDYLSSRRDKQECLSDASGLNIEQIEKFNVFDKSGSGAGVASSEKFLRQSLDRDRADSRGNKLGSYAGKLTGTTRRNGSSSRPGSVKRKDEDRKEEESVRERRQRRKDKIGTLLGKDTRRN